MENTVKCSMCYVTCASNTNLIRHIIRYHRMDRNFKVKCNYDGCGATFNKWKTFRQHLWRNHSPEITDHTENLEHDVYLPDDTLYDTNEVNQPPISGKEALLWHATKFLLNIREDCKVSQIAVEAVILGAQELITLYISIIMDELQQASDPESNLIDFNIVKRCFTEEYPPSSIFSEINSKKKLDKVLVENFQMILPQEHVIHKELTWTRKTNGQPVLQEIERSAYIVPFLKSLKLLVSNDDVRSYLQFPTLNNDNVYRTVLNGSIYKENEFFKNHPNSLAIILYYDDLGVANPLGVNSKSQKLSMFYWTIGNLDPRVRSGKNAIQLLAVVKTEWLNGDGALSKLLEPFIQDIIQLQTDGITITTNNGEVKNYKGSLLFSSGDTPASALLGGFKKSVSAYRLCRHCMVTQENWKDVFSERDCVLRNKDTHASHITAITNSNISERNLKFWRRRYGVNNKSPLLDIPNFDVTTGLPQDTMHILIEGVVELACRNLLHYLIIEKRIFSVEDFNLWRCNFNYYGHLKRDMPAVILIEHLTSKLRQNASQMYVLAHFLPFLIAGSVHDLEDNDIRNRLWSHIRLLQILNMCLAYEIHENSIGLLDRMIELYIRSFNLVYPNCLVPKVHFLLHLPSCIQLLGPARQQWCFRFENAHAYYKSLVPIVRNFKNMAYTCAYRRQANLCCNLTSFSSSKSRFLYQGHNIHTGVTVLLNNLPNRNLFHRYILEEDQENCSLLRTPKIEIYGTEFKQKSIILLQCNENCLPQFGEIQEIFIINDQIYFIYKFCATLFFDDKLNAYCIKKSNLQDIISYENLIFPHPLIYVKIRCYEFVGLLNNERNEFYG